MSYGTFILVFLLGYWFGPLTRFAWSLWPRKKSGRAAIPPGSMYSQSQPSRRAPVTPHDPNCPRQNRDG